MKIKVINLILIILLIGCSKSKFGREEKILTDFLKSDSFLTSKKCVVIIPSYGCGICTQDIIAFSKNNFENEKVLFIYSPYDKTKSLEFKKIIGFEETIAKDRKSELISLGLVDNKPFAYFIENNKIQEIIKFDDSTSNDIIEKIELSIK
ncbi:hypothetical protein NHF50_08460 [Flavobacterium sp. NRK F10]|uniref:hypothetical protein n=1 Tax=Flavobacterium sp. NRK F10 TaxID=2954931 RepID=UPI002090678B|nr:hypothetical protein [Flavobacterium sp. NRK F10]MCO6175078.1 hypothetical protein [Flavobacterium sp. NRK F10]